MTNDELTPRELQTLELLARGLPDVEIAARLTITISTIEKHKEHIFRKLGVRNRTEAANWYHSQQQ